MKINWDQSAETPSEKAPAPVLTGISAPKEVEAADEEKWTVDQLKAGKPMMVYYYIPASSDPKLIDCTEVNYKFARKTEMSAFQGDAVDRINKNWVPKKIEIAFDADHKVEKNQARIEFWAFTGKKLGSITHRNQQVLNPSDFENRLKDLEKKNREICNVEIKRINDEIARQAKEETAAK